MTYKNGDIYTGQWKKDVRDGQGAYKFEKQGVVAEGCYEKNEETGVFFYTMKDGSKRAK